jgi:Holliday junction DNA helicase RuvA
MISYLRGNLLGVDENRVILDVQGVGFEVLVPPGLLAKLPPTGEEVELYTHLYVREDAMQLFGFRSLAERTLFRQLLKAQGVGPRVALTILDTFKSEELYTAISQGDLDALQRVPGVGKKSAQRLLLELKGKLPVTLDPGPGVGRTVQLPVFEEVIQGLLALGYNRHEVEAILKKIDPQQSASTSAREILRAALKELGSGKR